MESEGVVFINSDGEYAKTGMSNGHGPTRRIIYFVKNINMADLFYSEHLALREFKSLKECQALNAVAIRTVKLTPHKAEKS